MFYERCFSLKLLLLHFKIYSVNLDKMVSLLQNWWLKVSYKTFACIENLKDSNLLYKKSTFPIISYNLLTTKRLVLHCFQKRQNTFVRAVLVSVISHLWTCAITRETLPFLEILPVVTRESFHCAWAIDGGCKISN